MGSRIFETNLAALRRFRPELFAQLEETLLTFNPTLCSEQMIPLAEAHFRVRASEFADSTLILFLGIGNGFQFQEFIKIRSKTHFSVGVIERDPTQFLRALCFRDFVQIFKDSTVAFFIDPDERRLANHLNSFFNRQVTVSQRLKIVPLPGDSESSARAWNAKMTARILSIKESTELSTGNSIHDTLFGLRNAVDNLPYAIANRGILPFADKFRGKACISVASGPSLNENLQELRALNGRIPIFACDSALKGLLENGITPDFVTAVEREPIVTKYFKGVRIPERTSLLGPCVLLKESLDAFEGDRVLYSSCGQFNKVLGLESNLGFLLPGQSAGNLNVAAAVEMGFETIVLVGHNLGHAVGTNASHFQGIGDRRELPMDLEYLEKVSATLQVPTQDGKHMIYTDALYNSFRVQIESWIGRDPSRKFVNTAFQGAKISGAEMLSLRDAVQKYVREDFDLAAIHRELVQPLSRQEVESRRKSLIADLERALVSLSQWEARLSALCNKLGGWATKIKEKEFQKSRVSLEYLNGALDELLNFKLAATEDDEIFRDAALSIFMSAHIAFEREINLMPLTYKNEYLLKRDFLLKHIPYFGVWQEFLPQIRAEYKRAADFASSIKVC